MVAAGGAYGRSSSKAAEASSRRVPDASAAPGCSSPPAGIALGHRRLSIIDRRGGARGRSAVGRPGVARQRNRQLQSRPAGARSSPITARSTTSPTYGAIWRRKIAASAAARHRSGLGGLRSLGCGARGVEVHRHVRLRLLGRARPAPHSGPRPPRHQAALLGPLRRGAVQEGLFGSQPKAVNRLSILTPNRRAKLTPLSGTAEVVPVVNRGDPRGFV